MKAVGNFKDECQGQLMLNLMGLRPRLYSSDDEREAPFDVVENGIEVEVEKRGATLRKRIVIANKNTAKGVKAHVEKRESFDDYKCCLRSLSSNQEDWLRSSGIYLQYGKDRVTCLRYQGMDLR